MPSKWLTAFREAEAHFPLNPCAKTAKTAKTSSAASETQDFRQFQPAEPCADGSVPKPAKTAKTSPAPTHPSPAPAQGRGFGSFGRFWQNGSDPETAEAKPAETLESRSAKKGFGSFGSFGTGVYAETDPETPPEVPQDPDAGTEPHVSVDALVADLKTLFGDDDPEREAAAERLGKARGVDGPVGDDLPAWQSWMNRRYTVWRTRGFSRVEALGIVWGEAENAWHLRHGAPPDPDRCAGCGMKILAGDGMPQIDGAVVHDGDPEHVECLAIHGAQWRSAASVGLMALGLMRPQS